MTHKGMPDDASQLSTYEIVVRGDLGERWSSWLHGLAHTAQIRDSSPELTVLTVQARDQAALRGLLNQLWDLNLTLIGIRRIPPHPDQGG